MSEIKDTSGRDVEICGPTPKLVRMYRAYVDAKAAGEAATEARRMDGLKRLAKREAGE